MEVNVKLQEKGKWSVSMTIKMIVIAFMIVFLLLPLEMIKSVIHEREENSRQVEIEMTQQWGSEQVVVGPVLNIPVVLKKQGTESEPKLEKNWLHIMPEQLSVSGQIDPEVRYRGIYKNVVYNSTIELKGSFAPLESLNDNTVDEIVWGEAFLTLGIKDNRGIKDDVDVQWGNTRLQAESGTVSSDISTSGLAIKLPGSEQMFKSHNTFAMTLQLSGSKSLSIAPVGKGSDIQLASAWKDPGFIGDFLPVQRQITDQGFTADWKVTHLNRNFPQQWIGRQYNVTEHLLGVNLFLPVNHYQKSMRSAKYGMLFNCLTILVLLFIELTRKKKIHLFQYLLVGLAMVLFFSILTALSEQLGFNLAYLLASITIIGMISVYTHAIFRTFKETALVGSLLVALYGFLFVLLQLNDYAFLAGNIGLVIALGAIMRASLKLPKEETA